MRGSGDLPGERRGPRVPGQGALVLALVGGLVIAGCGSSGGDKNVVKTVTVTQPTTAPKPATTPATPTTTPPPAETVRLESFRSPSGNIGCSLVGNARCDIRERDWSPPPKPADCDLDWGQGISVDGTEEAAFVCAGDTAMDPQAPALAYDTDSHVDAFRCQSREAGMTCRNETTGHGFFLARDRYRVF